MKRFLEPETRAFSRDIAKCSRCTRVLLRHDYGFDEYGQTLENCPTCGPMVLPRRFGAPLPNVKTPRSPEIIPGCLDCGGSMIYTGNGQRPARCVECRVERNRKNNLKRIREKRARCSRPLWGRAK